MRGLGRVAGRELQRDAKRGAIGRRLGCLLAGLSVVLAGSFRGVALGQATRAADPSYVPLRPKTTCPSDVEALTALLIRDLPGYTNRVLQRTVAALPSNETDGREAYRPSHVLIAGRAEFEPIDLDDYTLTTDPEAGGPISQVFFTTLSRQYAELRDRQVQEYHWLFLTQAEDGWRLAFMFSAIDDALTLGAALPPRESSEGSVGKAVQLWLRDCRAGAIYPLAASIDAPDAPALDETATDKSIR